MWPITERENEYSCSYLADAYTQSKLHECFVTVLLLTSNRMKFPPLTSNDDDDDVRVGDPGRRPNATHRQNFFLSPMSIFLQVCLSLFLYAQQNGNFQSFPIC